MNSSFHPNSPVISMSYATILVSWLEQKGIDRNSLLLGTNLLPANLFEADNFLTLAQFQTLYNRATMLISDSALGLHFGQQLNIASHGFLGYAVMSSENTLAALDVAMKYIKIRNRLISIDISFDKNETVLGLTTALKPGAFNRFMVEHAFSSLNAIANFLSGLEFKIAQFCFSYPPPDYADEYDRVLGAKIVFNGEKNQVFFKSNPDAVSALSDPQLASIAEQQCAALLATIDNQVSLPERVQKLIMQSAGSFPSSEFIAKQLGMSLRTLSRQLKHEGTSFKKIVDELKLNRATEYLSATHWSIDEIADLLGYSDPSNFRRAFKKWMGQSPSQYRDTLSGL